MFDAFRYSRELEAVGFSRDQAELQLRMITEIVEEDLATKQDLKILEESILNKIEVKLTHFEIKIEQLEYRLTIKLGALMLLGFTSMATLMKFWLGR